MKKQKKLKMAALLLSMALILSSCSGCPGISGIIERLREQAGKQTEAVSTEESTTEVASGEESTEESTKKDEKESGSADKESKKETKPASSSGKDKDDGSFGAGGEKKESSEKEDSKEESGKKESSEKESSKEESKKEEHEHKLVHIAAVPGSCTKDGNIEYWRCSDCGMCFRDAAATKYIEKPADLVAKATGHNVLFSKGYTPMPLTCMTQGTYGKYVCQTCGKEFLDEGCTQEVKSEADLKYYGPHSLVERPAAPAGCDYAGNSQYWECTSCGGYFSDKDGKVEIKDPSLVVVYPTGHNLVGKSAKPTCTTDGIVQHYECSKCGKWYGDDKGVNYIPDWQHSSLIIPASHSFGGWINKTTASCGGVEGHVECSVCRAWADDMYNVRPYSDFHIPGSGIHGSLVPVLDYYGNPIYDSSGSQLMECVNCHQRFYPKG